MAHILEDYPGVQLYNDVVNLLNDVNFPTPEVVSMMTQADKAWDKLDKSPCEPYVNYFAEKYPKLYKYHPKLMVNFILKGRSIDFGILKEFLKMREDRYRKKITKEQAERHFGPVLFKKYVEPILPDSRDHLDNLDMSEAEKIVEEEMRNQQ